MMSEQEDNVQIGLREGKLSTITGAGSLDYVEEGVFFHQYTGGKVFVPYRNIAYIVDGSDVNA